jgi:hypothetical protein
MYEAASMKTYTEKNYAKTINSTEKGVIVLRRILTGGSNCYVEKWPPGHYSTASFFYNLHGIDAVNLSNILRHKKVQSCIPEYIKSKSTPCISSNIPQQLHPNYLTTNQLCSA